MAKLVLTDASLTVNGVDLSDHVQTVTVQMDSEDLDATAMGATSRSHRAGLRDDRFTATFFQDYATGETDATLSPLIGSTGFTVIAKPTSAAVSATNPSYTGVCILLTYQPIAGTVGEMSMTEVEFPMAEGSKITRATA